MRLKFRNLAVIAVAAGVMAACADSLEVKNLNNPDLERVYGSATGIEGVVGTLFRTYHQGVAAAEGLNSQSKAFALESYGQVANFGMALRGGYPRIPIGNARGNQVTVGNNNNWSSLSRLMRTGTAAVQAVDRFTVTGTLGSPEQNRRARAFGFFVNGLAMGTLALGYDSVAVATPALASTIIPELIGYQAAMDTALRMLDSAQAIAEAGIQDIPAEWMASGAVVSPARFIQIIRSYRARLRANVARNDTEAAAVNWTLVAADAAAGITSNVTVALNSSTGWTSGLDASTFQTSASWHQVSLMYIGMADTSGAYQAFIAQPYATRIGMNVLIRTPDLRWPQGETRTAQVADQGALEVPAAGQYIINRAPANDQPDLSNVFGTSQYDHRRWKSISNANGVGTYVFLAKAEIDLLRAEALIRAGDFTNASPLVNATRTAAGLPAFNATSAADLAPGGAACVPRLPNGTCGNLLEAMKYEKRMETQLLGYMQWFNDSRRWNDLIGGTPLQWPVPNQEMDTRNKPFYNMPATGTLPAAAVGTYGF